MRVRCTHCGKELATASAAAIHVQRHPPQRKIEGGTWGPDAYVDVERWDAYAARTDPPNRAQEAARIGGDSVAEEPTISQHVGVDWQATACLCGCHYLKDCDEKECV